MKIKNAAVFLMIGSIYWILLRLYHIIDSFSETRLEYTKEHLIKWGFDSLGIILPISLLVLSIALMNNKSDVVSNEKEEVLINYFKMCYLSCENYEIIK